MSKFFYISTYGILIFIIFYLIYLIMSGTFCYCRRVRCPSHNINIYQSFIS